MRDDGHGAGFRGDEADGVETGVVVMVRREDLVTGLEVERAQDRVHAGGGVGNQRQIVGIGMEDPAEAPADDVEMRFELVGKELDRIPFHPRAPLRLGMKHRPRRRSERAVVEEIDIRVERPVAGEVRCGQALSKSPPIGPCAAE